jgi:hypothetical protein
MHRHKLSPLIRQLHRVVKKLNSLLRVNSNIVSKNVKQRWCSLFGNHMVLRRLQDDENINMDNMVQNRRTLSYDSEDDVDRRAEIFITKFRRQLSLERRIFG